MTSALKVFARTVFRIEQIDPEDLWSSSGLWARALIREEAKRLGMSDEDVVMVFAPEADSSTKFEMLRSLRRSSSSGVRRAASMCQVWHLALIARTIEPHTSKYGWWEFFESNAKDIVKARKESIKAARSAGIPACVVGRFIPGVPNVHCDSCARLFSLVQHIREAKGQQRLNFGGGYNG